MSSLILVEKKNKKQMIYIDPKDINNSLKSTRYPLPTFDRIIPDLSNAKIFFSFDARNDYWQIRLSE